jgi:alkylation response protein AidB-like acyl-CoA dehydrogenase
LNFEFCISEMDFSYAPEQEAFRAELRAWLQANVPREQAPTSLEGEAAFLTAWQRRLHEGGWTAVHWPREYGGRGASLAEQAIFQEEMARARAPQMMNRVGINLVGPTLIAHGTEAQRRRYLPPILSCDEIWCQLFSEPNAGSDLASLRTRAEPDGDVFRVSGQKVWTSYAQFASFGILLARTDPVAPQHRGISCFIVDMRSPGITIRPLRQLTGSAEFSETFFDGVAVPRENLIGAENDGWKVATTTLAHERGTAFPFKEQVLHKIYVDELADLLRRLGGQHDPVLRQRYAARFIDVEIMRLHNCRMMTRLSRGELPGAESSLVKLFWADLTHALNELAMEVIGPGSQLPDSSDKPWHHRFLWSLCGSIAGGTSEIQRNIIATRLLGLPRYDSLTH